MIIFEEARRLILADSSVLPAERVSLAAALGRVIAEDVVADADLVPYPRSAMDGYAVRAANTVGATSDHPLIFPIVGSAFAESGEQTLPPRTAIAVTTGAPIPHGADAVVPTEGVRRCDDSIAISAPLAQGDCVFPAGEDMRCGELLLRRGEVIRAPTLGLLAFVGRATLEVYRRPRVSLVCTGNELVDVTATPRLGQIRNSNAFTLAGLISECGAETRVCGTAPDDREVLAQMLKSARREADMVITTGGASVSERDLVKSTLAALGVEFRFRAVAVRPGKPMGFGTWEGMPVFVLPGNPAAAFVCFHEFVRPALGRLTGRHGADLPVVRAELRSHARSKPGRHYFVLARLAIGSAGLEVTPLRNQCSVLVRTSADANALIALPEGPAEFHPGDTVEVHVLDWSRVM